MILAIKSKNETIINSFLIHTNIRRKSSTRLITNIILYLFGKILNYFYK